MNLSMRIRIARQRARLSQEALAALLGVTRGAVANWECAVGAQPATARLERLAQVTGVCFEWLATGRGPLTYDGSDDLPAVDAELVHDPAERRLLHAYRLASRPVQKLLLQMAEVQVQGVEGRRRA
ncbi:helix-turn-helix domain-containing protein [Pseudoxanthomonas sp. SGNA-20]|jgi:Predicted transcriptional regulators|uniref:Putative transcriptional regulators n=2 Tax=Lysobacteraceae TaxID=32033 RepID=A0A562DI59_9GAMM|nr:helix-turn-helix domain-containing protein [Pseudoxanthomonas sp. SGNA-20]RRN79246.1 helix-turn-helix domain-containing protein [Pseudoxanthomonas sp. SGD-10]TWH09277.1 putative transcriptional regulators [Pseudoxanthomonas taiwanensis J19]